jgi:chromate transport protein ChrA
MKPTESHRPRVSRFALFLTFSRISLSSFGGAIFLDTARAGRLDLSALFLHFLLLWFVAIGPSAILPDIHRYVVEVHHLVTSTHFAEIYTLAQVAPGPNVMYVTLSVGIWRGGRVQPRPLFHCWCRLVLSRCWPGTSTSAIPIHRSAAPYAAV